MLNRFGGACRVLSGGILIDRFAVERIFPHLLDVCGLVEKYS